MQTHVKEAVATIGAFVALISVIHVGMWFTIFGTPDFTVLGFPFHYFWLVAGGPVAMFVLYAVYYRYITTAIMDEKKQLKADASEMSADPSEIDG